MFIAVARWHEGPNLGPRRFKIATELAQDAIIELSKHQFDMDYSQLSPISQAQSGMDLVYHQETDEELGESYY